MGVTVAATFCATLVDEWVRAGVTDAVVAPGSRSTPLALALAAEPRLAVHVHHDERAAGFLALGLGIATGRPAVVLTTSGTAAVELHPAVAEADLAGVPLLVCTADRPPELHHVGAPQALDQVRLYGGMVRWYVEPGAPSPEALPTWRSLGARMVAEALGGLAGRPGPVQANLAFRDPLVGEPGPLPEGRPDGRPWHRVLSLVDPAADPSPTVVDELAALLDVPNGVVVAGDGAGDPEAVHTLAAALRWPVLADPRSGCRVPARTTVAAFDAILRLPTFARAHTPAVVLRLGAPPASKVLFQWLAASGARQVALDGGRRWLDPERTAEVVAGGDPGALCRALAARVGHGPQTPWLARWARAEAAAQGVLAAALDGPAQRTEPAIARQLAAAVPEGGVLVTSSSMPVRDVEWYAAPRTGVRVVGNRGANGIDGVVSTAVGVALGIGAPTALLIGDVAFLHDSTALLGATGRDLDLTIVVVDNDGGGIFSFLPQAAALAPERFELLFGTPHGADVVALAAGVHGVAVHPEGHLAEVLRAGKGVRLVHVRTDRAANVVAHDDLHRRIAEAVGTVR